MAHNQGVDLSHIYWLGGSPCSGKSSIAALLADRYDLQVYHCDDFLFEHIAAALEDQPTLHSLGHMNWDEIFMRPVSVQVETTIAAFQEEFPLIVERLLALPANRPIIAEGADLLPHLVEPLLDSPQRAIWVVPTAEFQRAVYPQRGDWVQQITAQCSQPAQALQNWMERDVAYAVWIAEQAEQHGFTCLKVDGSYSIAENAAQVAAHFQLACD